MSVEPSENVLQLPAVADLTSAASLKSSLEQALSAGTGLVVDASSVQRISSPCLQILAAAKNTFLQAGGAQLTFRDPSAEFLETVSTLALETAMGLDGG